MALTNFISTVWSETLLSQMDKKYIAVANCNREFEGEIKNRGDRVKICGIGDINIFDYTKNVDFETGAQELTDSVKNLRIDQAKAFNFQIDDIDKAQQSPKLMKQAMPEYKPQDILDMLSQITLRDLAINFMLMNSFLAIVLSLPTAFVARLRKQ